MDARPGFFKYISTSENLKIPQAFGLQMQEVLANSVILRDRYENMWRMEVARVGDDWYFDEGWAKFYEENSLEPGNFLVFEYGDRNLFDFKLLGSDGCEKKGVGVLKYSFNKEYNGDGDDDNDDDDDDNSDDDDDDDDNNRDDDESEEEQDEEEEQVNTSNTRKFKRKFKPRNRKLSRSNTLGSRTVSSKRRHQKENVHRDYYGADIFKSGLVPQPKNPYFVTRSRTSRKNELHIPKKVIEDYHLEIPKKLFLVDEKGRKWQTKIKQWKDGRLWCTRGWKSLCNMNNIDKDDVCICEFVQEEDSEDVHMLVHVLDIASQ